MRRTATAAAIVAAAAAAAVASAAGSAHAGTPVTFTVSGNGISITQPSSTANLAGGTLSLTGSTVSGTLGSTSVTDLRTGLAGSWTDSVTGPAAGFSDGSGDTVATSAATMWVNATDYASSPLPTSALRSDLHITQLTGVTLSGTAQALVTATTLGTNTATFTPSVQVAIPNTAAPGTYTGTITQTVS